jgi:hypothetical protein
MCWAHLMLLRLLLLLLLLRMPAPGATSCHCAAMKCDAMVYAQRPGHRSGASHRSG